MQKKENQYIGVDLEMGNEDKAQGPRIPISQRNIALFHCRPFYTAAFLAKQRGGGVILHEKQGKGRKSENSRAKDAC